MVSGFLRDPEYYQRIMFLTPYRAKQLDDAIASRIRLPLKYKPLGLDASKSITDRNPDLLVSERSEVRAVVKGTK